MRLQRLEGPDNFPNLIHCDHSQESNQTPAYNCIAFAAGDQRRKWWPVPKVLRGGQWFWPDGIPTTSSFENFIAAFALLGYEPCENADFEENVEKVAIYGREDGKTEHMAVQVTSGDHAGKWASKLGGDVDIVHSTLEGLAGRKYGQPRWYMKRPKPNQPWGPAEFSNIPGYPS